MPGDRQGKQDTGVQNKHKAKTIDRKYQVKNGYLDRPTPINTSDVIQEPPTTTINGGLSRRRNIVSGKRTKIG